MHINIDPVIFYIAGYPILRWYSLAYILGFVCAYVLFRKYNTFLNKEQTETMFNYAFFGVILGGRFGYVLFYNLPYYLQNPLEAFAVWQWGMSFHGGLLGVIAGLWLFCKRYNVQKGEIADIAPMCVTPGLFFGRIANFINGELWGAETQLPIGFVFPQSGTIMPRHATQLYEALLEGLILFMITFLMFRKKKVKNAAIAGWFVILYGMFRFMIEFVREPDAQLGYILFNTFTMGHLLCFVMVLSGSVFLFYIKIR